MAELWNRRVGHPGGAQRSSASAHEIRHSIKSLVKMSSNALLSNFHTQIKSYATSATSTMLLPPLLQENRVITLFDGWNSYILIVGSAIKHSLSFVNFLMPKLTCWEPVCTFMAYLIAIVLFKWIKEENYGKDIVQKIVMQAGGNLEPTGSDAV